MSAGAGAVSIGEIFGRLFLVDEMSPALALASNNLNSFKQASAQFAQTLHQTSQGLTNTAAAATHFSGTAAKTGQAVSGLASALTGAGGAGAAAAGGIGAAATATGRAGTAAGTAGGHFQGMGMQLFGVMTASNLAADAITGFATSIIGAVAESAKLAMRVEMLQGVARYMARQQGFSAEQTDRLAESLKLQGITSKQAFDTISQLVRVNIDLSKATELAAIAQNTARIANLNSSETLGRLIHGIVTLNSRVLHTIGLNVTLQSAAKGVANETGKSLQQMTQAEKQQTMYNAILRAASTTTGVYAETMEFAGGRLLTLERFQEEANLAIGRHFLTAARYAVDGATALAKWVMRASDAVVMLGGSVVLFAGTMAALEFASWISKFGLLAKAITAVNTAMTMGGLTGALGKAGIIGAVILFANGLREVIDSLTDTGDAFLTWDEKILQTITASTLMAKAFSTLKNVIQNLALAVRDAASFQLSDLFGFDTSSFNWTDMLPSISGLREWAQSAISTMDGWGDAITSAVGIDLSAVLPKLTSAGDAILDWLTGFGDSIVAEWKATFAFDSAIQFPGIGAAIDFIAEKFTALKEMVVGLFEGVDLTKPLKDFAATFAGLGALFGKFRDMLSLGQADRALIGVQPGGLIKDVLAFSTQGLDQVAAVLDSVAEGFNRLAGLAAGTAQSISRALGLTGSTIKSTWTGVTDWIGDTFESAVTGVNSVIDSIASTFGDITDPIDRYLTTVAGYMDRFRESILQVLRAIKSEWGSLFGGEKPAEKAAADSVSLIGKIGSGLSYMGTAGQVAALWLARQAADWERIAKANEKIKKAGGTQVATTIAEANAILGDEGKGLAWRQTQPFYKDMGDDALENLNPVRAAKQLHEAFAESFKAGARESEGIAQQYTFVYDRLFGTVAEHVKGLKFESNAFAGLGKQLDGAIQQMDKTKKSAEDLAQDFFNQGGTAKEWKGAVPKDIAIAIVENRKEAFKDLGKEGNKAAEELNKAWEKIRDAEKGAGTLKSDTADWIMLLTEQGVNVSGLAKEIATVTKESESAVKAFAKIAEVTVGKNFKFSGEQARSVLDLAKNFDMSAKDIADSMDLPSAAVKRFLDNVGKLPEEAEALKGLASTFESLGKVSDAAFKSMLADQVSAFSAAADVEKGLLRERELFYATTLDREVIALRHQKEDEIAQYWLLKQQIPEVYEQIVGLIEDKYERLTSGVIGFNQDIVEEMRKLGILTRSDLEEQAEVALNNYNQMVRSFDAVTGKSRYTTGALNQAWDIYWEKQRAATDSWRDRFHTALDAIAREIADTAEQLAEIMGPGKIGSFFQSVAELASAITLASAGRERGLKGAAQIFGSAEYTDVSGGDPDWQGPQQIERTRQLAQGVQNLSLGLLQLGIAFEKATDAGKAWQRAIGGAITGSSIGEEIGMAFGGPVGAVWGKWIGAIAGAIIGALRKPAWVDVAKRVMYKYGVEISEELARGIADAAKEMFHGNRQAAEIFNIGKILAESDEGLNSDTIDKWAGHLRDVFVMFQQGVFTAAQAMKVLEENWGDFAEAGTDAMGVLNDAMRENLRLARELGLLTESMIDYIQEQVSGVADSWNDVIEAATDGFERYKTRIDDVQKALDGLKEDTEKLTADKTAKQGDAGFKMGDDLLEQLGKTGDRADDIREALRELNFDIAKFAGMSPDSAFLALRLELVALGDAAKANRLGEAIFGDDWQKYMRDMDEFGEKARQLGVETTDRTRDLKLAMAEQRREAERNREMLTDLGIVAAGVFGAMMASGKTFFEALRAAAPGLESLRKAYENLGISAEDSGVQFLMLLASVQKASPALFAGIEGLSGTITGLANVGMLTSSTIGRVQNVAVSLYQRLQGEISNAAKAAGDFSDHTADALLPMQEFLRSVSREAERLGVPLDARIQDMIDQSRAAGIWKDSLVDPVEEAARRQEALFSGLSKTIQGFAMHMETALKGVSSSIGEAIDRLATLLAGGNPFASWVIPGGNGNPVTGGGGTGGSGGGVVGGDGGGTREREAALTTEALLTIPAAALTASRSIESSFMSRAVPALEATASAVNDVIQMHSPTGLEGIIHYAGQAGEAFNRLAANGTMSMAHLKRQVGGVVRELDLFSSFENAAWAVQDSVAQGQTNLKLDSYLSDATRAFKNSIATDKHLTFLFSRYLSVESAMLQSLRSGQADDTADRGSAQGRAFAMHDAMFRGARDGLLDALTRRGLLTGLPPTDGSSDSVFSLNAMEGFVPKIGTHSKLNPTHVTGVVALAVGEHKKLGEAAGVAAAGMTTEAVSRMTSSARVGMEVTPGPWPITAGPWIPLPPPMLEPSPTGPKMPGLVPPDRNTTLPVPGDITERLPGLPGGRRDDDGWRNLPYFPVDSDASVTDRTLAESVVPDIIYVDGTGLSREEAVNAALAASPEAWALDRYGTRKALLSLGGRRR